MKSRDILLGSKRNLLGLADKEEYFLLIEESEEKIREHWVDSTGDSRINQKNGDWVEKIFNKETGATSFVFRYYDSSLVNTETAEHIVYGDLETYAARITQGGSLAIRKGSHQDELVFWMIGPSEESKLYQWEQDRHLFKREEKIKNDILTQTTFIDGKKNSIDDRPAIYVFDTLGQLMLSESYMKDGELHRDGDKPADINCNKAGQVISRTWSQNGKIHRETGPAYIHYTPERAVKEEHTYYLHNESMTKEEWEKRVG